MDAAVSPQPLGTPVNGNGANGINGVSTGAPLVAIDPARVVEHLAHLLEAALGASRDELEAPGSLLSRARYNDTLQRCTRFANDTIVCLYIQKDLPAAPQLENGDVDSSMAPLPPSKVRLVARMLIAIPQSHRSTHILSHPICSQQPPPLRSWSS